MRALLLVVITGCAIAPAGVTPLMPPGARSGAGEPADKIHTSVWTIASTTPRIEGRVRERAGDVAVGVTVVAVTATRLNQQTAITDEAGRFHMDDVVPGVYELTFYYNDATYRLYRVGTAAATTTEIDLVVDPLPSSNAKEAQIL